MCTLFVSELFGIGIEVYFILLILGTPVYFILRKIFRRFIKDDKQRGAVLWTSTILLTPVLYVSLILLFFSIISYYPKNSFNKKEWLDNKEERYKLSDDIIDSKMLIGKTKNEVRKLLGDGGNKESSDEWYYDLGFRPEFANIDPDSLEIDFKNDRVISVTQHRG